MNSKSDINPFNIAFCINEAYANYACVPILSILKNHPDKDLNIHVISDGLSDKSFNMLNSLFKEKNHKLSIHIVSDKLIEGLKVSKFSKYTWYRVLAPELLKGVHRLLYLDTDVVTNCDLAPIFAVELTNKSIASVVDDITFDKSLYHQADIPYDQKYICAGVLLMNLDYWREHHIAEKIVAWARENEERIVYPDQDAINHVCNDSKVLLPLRYGITHRILSEPHFYEKYPDEVIDCINNPTIIHYNVISPWFMECTHPLLEIWDKYNTMLGKYKVKLRYKYPQSLIARLKTRLWYALHPSIPRNHQGIEKMQNQMQKHGIEVVEGAKWGKMVQDGAKWCKREEKGGKG